MEDVCLRCHSFQILFKSECPGKLLPIFSIEYLYEDLMLLNPFALLSLLLCVLGLTLHAYSIHPLVILTIDV